MHHIHRYIMWHGRVITYSQPGLATSRDPITGTRILPIIRREGQREGGTVLKTSVCGHRHASCQLVAVMFAFQGDKPCRFIYTQRYVHHVAWQGNHLTQPPGTPSHSHTWSYDPQGLGSFMPEPVHQQHPLLSVLIIIEKTMHMLTHCTQTSQVFHISLQSGNKSDVISSSDGRAQLFSIFNLARIIGMHMLCICLSCACHVLASYSNARSPLPYPVMSLKQRDISGVAT